MRLQTESIPEGCVCVCVCVCVCHHGWEKARDQSLLPPNNLCPAADGLSISIY